MKTLTRVILLIYPRSWRKRYSAEFEALLADIRPGIIDLLDIVLSGIGARMRVLAARPVWQTILAFMVLGGVLGTAVAQFLPRQYQSTAVLQVETSTTNRRHIARSVVDGVLEPQSLQQIIKARNLYGDTSLTEQEQIERLKAATRISAVEYPLKAIKIHFVSASPQSAQRITTDLVNLFQQANSGSAVFKVIDRASLPSEPVFPNVRNIIVSGLLAGLLTGMLVTVLTTQIRRQPPAWQA